MSALSPSISNRHDDAISSQPIYSPLKKRTLSTAPKRYPANTADESYQANSYDTTSSKNSITKEQCKSPIDEHHDEFVVHQRNQLNYFNELFYQNSSQTYGSPITKDNNIPMSTTYSNRWKLTTDMPRPLNLLNTLEPFNGDENIADRTIKRQRTLDLFTIEGTTVDDSLDGTLILRPQLENGDQIQAHLATPLMTTPNDTQNTWDLQSHHPRQYRSTTSFIGNNDHHLLFMETNRPLNTSTNQRHNSEDTTQDTCIDYENLNSNKSRNNSATKSAIQNLDNDRCIQIKATTHQYSDQLDKPFDSKAYPKENIDLRQQQQQKTEILAQLQNDNTETQAQLDSAQQLHSLGGSRQTSQDQDMLQKHTTERIPSQPDIPQQSQQPQQKQEHPFSENSDHNQQPTQQVTMKDGQNDTTPTSSMKTDQQNARMERLQQEMDALAGSVKKLSTHYRLLKKVGSGTFSSVYKALDILHDNYDNTMWEGITTPNSSSRLFNTSEKEIMVSATESHQQKYVALKQIYSTSSPKRMAQEIKILKHLKGAPYVCQLITAFRSKDHVYLVMPYFKHYNFMDYYRDMNLVDIKYYMTALLTALKHLHGHRILHRDIKPNNFLYEKSRMTGMLIDFGLAQMESETRPPEPPKSNPSKSALVTTFYRQRSFPDTKPTSSTARLLRSLTPISMNEVTEGQLKKPGYIKNDQRKPVRASKAGTSGFRAPEVLLRVTHQTVAIDIWSVGVIMLSLLSGQYPFFIGRDESDSLIEIASIFGMAEMKDCAALHNRTFETNIGTIPCFRKSLSTLCQVLNTEKLKSWTEDNKQTLDHAMDLLEKMLTLNYKTRITAEDALKHPFLSDTPPLPCSSSG